MEPYNFQWVTEEEYKKLLTLVMVAWNAAINSGNKRDEFTQRMVEIIPSVLRSDMRTIVAEMIQRKLTYFANNKRMILDFQVTMTPAEPHVFVASTADDMTGTKRR